MTERKDYPPEEHAGPVIANYRHVSPEEARQANDPRVGAGTPDSAPLETPPDWTLGGRVRALLSRLGGAR